MHIEEGTVERLRRRKERRTEITKGGPEKGEMASRQEI